MIATNRNAQHASLHRCNNLVPLTPTLTCTHSGTTSNPCDSSTDTSCVTNFAAAVAHLPQPSPLASFFVCPCGAPCTTRVSALGTMLAMISKVLGLAVVLGATVVKFPQIFTIYKNKSAAGLSFLMFALDLIRYARRGSG